MEIDLAIDQVSQLYRTLTGQEMPAADTPYAPIPPEEDPIAHVQAQVDRLVGALQGADVRPPAPPWAPAVTVYESPEEIVFAFDVPGAVRDAIDVRVQGAMLVVAGQRGPSLSNGHAMRAAESRFGTFRRVVPLRAGLRTTELNARLENGVLEVRIPRDDARGARRVSVG